MATAMIQKPEHVRVRAREGIGHSPAGVRVLPLPKTTNLPQGGQVGRWVGESRVLGHENKTGHEMPARQPSRKERKEVVIAWMVTHGITRREVVFAGCPDARRSASLHHAAITVLLKSGLIERVWREYVFCVDEKEATAWLMQRKSRTNYG